jgi:hypothetical protein
VLESLLRNPEAASSELFVFSDGPRNADDVASVEAVRKIARSIQGFAKVNLIERPENWGLAKSVIGGVTEICGSHGTVIVLEDDLVVSPHLLAYLNEALKKYSDEERVMQVSGHMFPVRWTSNDDAAFLPMTTSWGWATWQRAWAKFRPDLDGTLLLASPDAQKAFDLDGSYPYFNMLLAQRQGKVDSWAIRWWLSVFLEQGKTLFPAQSLVQNIGFDGTGTHCGVEHSSPVGWTDFHVQKFPGFQIDLLQFAQVKSYLAERNRPHGLLSKLKGLFK